MKKTIKKTAIGLFTILTLATGFTTYAGEPTEGAVLKIAGQVNNQPVFQLDLNNDLKERFVIVIKDEFGTILYEEYVSGANISKKFRFTDELEGVNLRFEIRDVKNSKTVVFAVKNRKKTVSETAIVKS
jgi:hypothetical protein